MVVWCIEKALGDRHHYMHDEETVPSCPISGNHILKDTHQQSFILHMGYFQIWSKRVAMILVHT
jgi:hypothetical protein